MTTAVVFPNWLPAEKPPIGETVTDPPSAPTVSFAEMLIDRSAQSRTMAELAAAPLAIPFLATDVFGRSVLLPYGATSDPQQGPAASPDQQKMGRTALNSGPAADASAQIGSANPIAPTSPAVLALAVDPTEQLDSRDETSPRDLKINSLQPRSFAPMPEGRPATGIAPAIGSIRTGGAKTNEPAAAALPRSRASAWRTTPANVAASASYAVADERQTAVSVTLHLTGGAMELAARIAGTAGDETELARGAQELIARSGFRLVGLTMNGRRLGRPSRR